MPSCQSPAARAMLVPFAASLVQRLARAEAEAQGGAAVFERLTAARVSG